MNCGWESFLAVLPPGIRKDVNTYGREALQELRLALGYPPVLVMGTGRRALSGRISRENLAFVVNAASRYSPWAAGSQAQGYLTAPGGHRIGLCGEAVVTDGVFRGIRCVTSACLRVARDFPGLARDVGGIRGSVLILGPPGSGKTTLLRDLIRQRAARGWGSVAVVDERGEIFPENGFDRGMGVDVLTGCPKVQGLDIVLRTMGPATVAVDEITGGADCEALVRCGWCGVDLLATAHAHCREDLFRRPVYRPLVEGELFDTLLILQRDKTYRREGMRKWKSNGSEQ